MALENLSYQIYKKTQQDKLKFTLSEIQYRQAIIEID